MPEDLLPPFLLIARAYGTSSLGQIRRLLDHLGKAGLIVVRTNYA